MNGRVGYKDAAETSTFVEGSVVVAYAVTDKTQLFVAGIGGTSTAEGTDNVIGFQAGVTSAF